MSVISYVGILKTAAVSISLNNIKKDIMHSVNIRLLQLQAGGEYRYIIKSWRVRKVMISVIMPARLAIIDTLQNG